MKKIKAIIIIEMIIISMFCLSMNKTIIKYKPITLGISGTTEVKQKPKPKPVINYSSSYRTRMTSFWVGDDCNSGDMTASGKSSKDFGVNGNGWYTWNGMLVIATASHRLGNTNQRTYNLYDQVTLVINGNTYKAVVLDVCGACMRDNRIDLFVKDYASAIDTNVEIRK